MVVFKRTNMLNDEDKKQLSEMCGKMMVWIIEGESVSYMAEKLKMYPWHVDANIDEMLYTLKKRVGWKRYLRILFRK